MANYNYRTLILFLVGLVIFCHIIDSNKADRLSSIEDEYIEERRQKQEELAKLEASDSFYRKLTDGFDVDILIVGDSIGNFGGSYNWSRLLGNEIKDSYNVDVKLRNISMGGNTSYAGYGRTLALSDKTEYDLVVLCYGQNDKTDDFDIYYEALIRAVKTRYPKASVISILESSQRDYTEKMQTIQSLCEYYGIPTVDTIAPFKENYSSLTNDGVHPNEEGNEIYFNEIMKLVNERVKADYGFDPELKTPVNESVTVFDKFQWFNTGDFTREGNTFTLKVTTTGTVLGIDYCFVPGENSCTIYVDGKEYAAPEVTFDYDFSQRHFMVVNNWQEGEKLDVQKEIKVVFANDEKGKEQADGFYGIMING